MYKFWMIIRGDEQGNILSNSPSKRHYLFKVAKEEMERLCKKEGKPFYLLEAVERIAPADVPLTWDKVTELKPCVVEGNVFTEDLPDDIPEIT